MGYTLHLRIFFVENRTSTISHLGPVGRGGMCLELGIGRGRGAPGRSLYLNRIANRAFFWMLWLDIIFMEVFSNLVRVEA